MSGNWCVGVDQLFDGANSASVVLSVMLFGTAFLSEGANCCVFGFWTGRIRV